MLQAIIGTKIDQSRRFTQDGTSIPVTNVRTAPIRVVAVKTVDRDGYSAVQLGFGARRAKTITKPQLGGLKKAGLDQIPPRFLKEVPVEEIQEEEKEALSPGKEIRVMDVLQAGDVVAVTGVSKGKGFAGVVKRHGFKGGPRTHGQSDRERAPGSIGQTTTPGRVYRGKRMAGRMGNDQVTVKNLKVISIDGEKGMLTISGVVPGGRNGLLVIRKIGS